MLRVLSSKFCKVFSGRNRVTRACLAGLLVALMAAAAVATPLDDYVAAADASYSFSITNTTSGTGYTLYTVSMTSQTWRDPSEVSHNAWQHNMQICVPNTVTSDKALLTITGGSHGAIRSVDTNLAVSTGSVVAIIATVPNQPIKFAGETFYRSEDGIIAKTARIHMDGGDDYWPALLPMVKSASKAMDTVSSVALDEKGVSVNKFVLTGESKRGWTSWLTAAVDSRVCAVAPSVINVLNMDEQMRYTKKVFEGVTQQVVGGYPRHVQDYVNEGILDDLDSTAFQDLLTIFDPYEYRDRLTMPKLMLNSTGDEFFVPDSCQHFLNDIPGDNYLRFQPNMGHGINSSGYTTLTQFYHAMVKDTDLPDYSWTIEPDGSIRLSTVDEPTEVKLWQSTNPDNRDFRQNISGTTWAASVLAEHSPGVYIASVPRPASGYTALMAEMTYNVGGELMTFTTEVNVVPEPSMLVLLLASCAAMLCRRPQRR